MSYDALPVHEQKKIDDADDAIRDTWSNYNDALDKLFDALSEIPIEDDVFVLAEHMVEFLRKLKQEKNHAKWQKTHGPQRPG